MTPRETPIRIVRQGAIRVASACVEHEGEGIVAVSIDCHTKRYEVTPCSYGPAGGGWVWALYLYATDETLRPADGVDRDVPTEIELPEFASGWDVFTHDYHARYVARLCLVRRASDEQPTEDDDGN